MSAAGTALSVWQLDLPSVMTTEDVTNAVWNRILHETFPSPHYIISPEFQWENSKKKQEGRADLAVVVAGTRNVVLAFEGKGAGGGSAALTDALTQATNCLAAVNSQMGVAIAALGPVFVVTDIGMNETKKFKPTAQGAYLVQNNIDQIADYLKKTAGMYEPRPTKASS